MATRSCSAGSEARSRSPKASIKSSSGVPEVRVTLTEKGGAAVEAVPELSIKSSSGVPEVRVTLTEKGWAAVEAVPELSGAGPGRKNDTGKQRWDLLPFGVISLVVAVMTFGANKYEANNWQKILAPDGRYFAALMRHLVAWRLNSASVDDESGLPHLAHALCCLVFITSRAIGFDRILDVPHTGEV